MEVWTKFPAKESKDLSKKESVNEKETIVNVCDAESLVYKIEEGVDVRD